MPIDIDHILLFAGHLDVLLCDCLLKIFCPFSIGVFPFLNATWSCLHVPLSMYVYCKHLPLFCDVGGCPLIGKDLLIGALS